MSQATIGSLLNASRIQCEALTTSKKKSLQLVAQLIEDSLEPNPDDEDDVDMDVIDALAAREKLGCTGMGHGIAIPHGRVDFIDEPVGALVTLAEPVNFDAPDKKPVDIVFGLLIPEESTEEHLHILASLAGFFNSEQNREKMRAAKTPAAILDMLGECEIKQSKPSDKKASNGAR